MKAWIRDGLPSCDLPVIRRLCRGEIPEGASPVRERILRRVLRVALPSGRTCFAKQHLLPFLRVRLRYLFRSSPTRRERARLEKADSRGLLVPRPLAEATKRSLLLPRLAVLVTGALPEGKAPSPGELLDGAQALSRAGIFHPDLHTDNLRMLPEGGRAFLDFQSCRATRGPLPRSLRERMFARAVQGLLSRCSSEELRLHLEGLGLPAAGILHRAEGLARRYRASRRRHSLRNSTEVRRERRGLFGCRLSLRGARLPEAWGEETPLELPHLGTCMLARSLCGEIHRIRAGRGLKEVWIRARTMDLQGASRILGWERNTPWQKGGESLYISGAVDGSPLLSLLDPSIHPGPEGPVY